MKTIYSIAILLFISLGLRAQVNVKYIKAEKELGQDFSKNQPIVGEEFTFPLSILNASFDSVKKTSLINLGEWVSEGVKKKAGYLFMFDFVEEKVRWAQKANVKNEYNYLYPGLLLQRKAGVTVGLDYNTGLPKWEVENQIAEVDLDLNIGLALVQEQGYNTVKEYLKGIDLTSGATVWTRNFPYLHAYEKSHPFGDHHMLLELSGMHEINMLSGNGWDYDAVTTHRVAAADNSGNYTLTRLSSNVLFEEKVIFYGSQSALSCVDYDGKVLWSTPLDKDYTSESWVFTKGDNVILLNKGSAHKGKEKVKFGIPYLASFDSNTGEKKYSLNVTRSREYVNAYKVMGDTLLAFFGDRISICDMAKGDKIDEISIDLGTDGKFSQIMDNRIYIQKNDNAFINLKDLYAKKEFLLTDKNKVVGVNAKFERSGKYNVEELLFSFLNIDDFHFLYGGDKVYVVNKMGEKVAEINFSDQPHLVGNKLYEVRKSSIVVVDLLNILPSTPKSIRSRPDFLGTPIRDWYK